MANGNDEITRFDVFPLARGVWKDTMVFVSSLSDRFSHSEGHPKMAHDDKDGTQRARITIKKTMDTNVGPTMTVNKKR